MTVSRAVTPEKIEAAVKRLVEVARPSRIILFGSAARGDMHQHSDVDLLVVLPELPDESYGEAVNVMYAALTGLRMATDIIAVSEERLAELADRPSLVYREALRTGRVVYEAPRMSPPRKRRKKPEPSDAGLPHTWLAHARSDLALARIARGNPAVLSELVCFHAQQAAEKAVKAVLLARNVNFPYTLSLTELLDDVTSHGQTVPDVVAGARELTRYAARTRYPHSEAISESQVDDAMRIAEALVTWATPLVPIPRRTT
jgi:HEPN domain-containing protein/predicted nucleotidyltransferase